MAERRLGILGGTFNPIHLGHLVLAEAFRERLALDRVLFVPGGTPPPTSRPAGLVPALHRYAMVSLAVAGASRVRRLPDRDRARAGRPTRWTPSRRVAGDWPGRGSSS